MDNFGIDILECFRMDYEGYGVAPKNYKKCRLHAHSFYQYLYVAECNNAVIAIDNELMPIVPNALYLIKPSVQHAVFGRQKLKTIELKFHLNNPYLEDIARMLPAVLLTQGSQVGDILSRLISEYKNSSFNDPMFYIKFYELLLVLNRLGGLADGKCLKFKDYITLYNESLRSLISFMYDNYSRHISLEEMAGIVHFEKNYFIKAFKNEFNCTPMQFLNIIRANRAMNLLEYTDNSIETIARDTGFASVASLTNFFRTNFNITPTEHRVKHREAIKQKNNTV
ncbi:MAG: helix-turn-helix transcriptional regulator [Ruminococcaceae bacterium]|nr:helix-turn-helix transcriptional regulator [Oscillospiraceae bacterium]